MTKTILLCAILGALFCASGAASAEQIVKTTPNQPVVVDRVQGAVKPGTAKFGTVGAMPDSETPPNTVVIYAPPAGDNEFDDPISYTAPDGAVKKATVQVRKADPTATDSIAYRESFRAIFELLVIAVRIMPINSGSCLSPL